MMDMPYHQPQPYHPYQQTQWPSGVRTAFAEPGLEAVDDERASNSTTPATFTATQQTRRQSVMKAEDDSYAQHMWYNSQHNAQLPLRHFSQSNMALVNTTVHHQPGMRYDPAFAASYAQPHPQVVWPHYQSETSTPTTFASATDGYAQQAQFGAPAGFNFNQDPLSATSMSPQSSTGGWASATSAESAEQRAALQSPSYRPISPQLVQRSDGVRKKNARFEIPRERNLQTIDNMIQNATDETEKKELKQQKRLLRNRQAALDSRQRKKSHTEQLESDKRILEKKICDGEELNAALLEQLHQTEQANERLKNDQHQYEIAIQHLKHERDESLCIQKNEMADLRRQNNMLKDYIRELERQQPRLTTDSSGPDVHTMATEFNDFNFDEEWDSEFSLVDGEDFRLDDQDTMQRQSTPRPTPSQTAASSKPDLGFSWNTFYMCLLFGAFIASSGTKSTASSASNPSGLLALSDEYRTEAGNVLKAVLSAESTSVQDSGLRQMSTPDVSRTTISGSELAQMTKASAQPHSTLDQLSSMLTKPSQEQQVRAAFAMTPSSYNNIMNPMASLENDVDYDLPDAPKQTPIARAFAELQAKNKERERAAGIRYKADERSALVGQIPDQVLRDFRELVRQSNAGNTQDRFNTP